MMKPTVVFVDEALATDAVSAELSTLRPLATSAALTKKIRRDLRWNFMGLFSFVVGWGGG
jgi:hypothetical protein